MFNSKGPNETVFYCCIAVYAIMLILGAIQTTLKTKPNPYFGIRVSWTMHDQEVWDASQKIGGIALMIGSLMGIGLSLYLRRSHPLALLATMILNLLLVASISLGGSYRTYKEKQNRQISNEASNEGDK